MCERKEGVEEGLGGKKEEEEEDEGGRGKGG